MFLRALFTGLCFNAGKDSRGGRLNIINENANKIDTLFFDINGTIVLRQKLLEKLKTHFYLTKNKGKSVGDNNRR